MRVDRAPLDTRTTYKAVVTSTPLPPLSVAFEGDPAALDSVRQSLASINGPDAPSLLVRESDLAAAEYRLLADAADSPIVKRGSANQVFGGLMVGYQF